MPLMSYRQPMPLNGIMEDIGPKQTNIAAYEPQITQYLALR